MPTGHFLMTYLMPCHITKSYKFFHKFVSIPVLSINDQFSPVLLQLFVRCVNDHFSLIDGRCFSALSKWKSCCHYKELHPVLNYSHVGIFSLQSATSCPFHYLLTPTQSKTGKRGKQKAVQRTQ